MTERTLARSLCHTPARDRAWGRWFGRKGAHSAVERTSHGKWQVAAPPTPAERREAWRRQYEGIPVEMTIAPVRRRA